MSDLTPESLLTAMKNIWATPTGIAVPRVILSPQAWADATAIAKRDPEFARQVLAEFGIDLLNQAAHSPTK